jgi:hypothetical protein
MTHSLTAGLASNQEFRAPPCSEYFGQRQIARAGWVTLPGKVIAKIGSFEQFVGKKT